MSVPAIGNGSLETTAKKDNTACLLAVLWSKEKTVSLTHCHLGSNHMLCACVGNIGLLCLLENGKFEKHSYRVTDISLNVSYNYSSSGLEIIILPFSRFPVLIAERGFNASHLERTEI